MEQDPVARTVMRHLKETELKQSEWGKQFEKVILPLHNVIQSLHILIPYQL